MRHQLHSETRETPAEFGESTNSAPCFYALKCGNTEVDMDEDTFATVDTPIGELILCEEHMKDGNPVIMCACGEDDLPVEHTGVWQWKTAASVVVIDGEMWSMDCAAEKQA